MGTITIFKLVLWGLQLDFAKDKKQTLSKIAWKKGNLSEGELIWAEYLQGKALW